ncbi:FAD-dependent oxidoreductase [Microlunatus soli]|uniref:2-polyprenyl-6-methoxyphenol hydroxylase n=1 Tax=Microlunatus soli TaxID=630515 RepID=A0A1H1SDS6_9ACTN|nr:FAD-dependent oxidoreductase [Microlunatus soli]SDS45529.1 2-polyprenyl-6-methoxyphenol hydroxylase [Microlunatus soli]
MDVAIIGAGPTGLALALELGRAGASVLVVEAAAERNRQSRASGIQPRTTEVLQMRGLLSAMQPYVRSREQIGGHFAGLPVPLDTTPFGSRFPVPVSIGQYDLECVLEAELAAFPQVELWRGAALTDLQQLDDGVTGVVRSTAETRQIRADYLIGADGAHSRVRRLAEIGFPGRAGLVAMAACDIRLSGVEDETPGHFSRYLHPHADGLAILSPLGNGVHRLLFGGSEQQGLDRNTPVGRDEVQRALTAACGPDVGLVEILHASRFSDASRQAETYRKGRVLLAGDAAHIHLPAGGQGINLGIQDAMNLGWKLGAVVAGRLPQSVLDSYHTERHPVAERVLVNTRAQGLLMGADHPDLGALRSVFTDLLRLPDANRYLSGMVSGLDTRYPMPGTAHPLLGLRMPDLPIADETADAGHRSGAGRRHLSDLQHRGDGLLVDLGAGLPGWATEAVRDVPGVTIATVAGPVDDDLPGLALVRPDGHVCATDAGGPDELAAALQLWFGASMPTDTRPRSACNELVR